MVLSDKMFSKIIAVVSILVLLQIDYVCGNCYNLIRQQRIEGSNWIGIFELQGNFGETMNIRLHAVVDGVIRNNYYGSILLNHNNNIAVQRLINNQPLEFKATIPYINLLPTITNINVNGKTICSSSPDLYRQYTNIDLRYEFSSYDPNLPSRYTDNYSTNIYKEDTYPQYEVNTNNYNPVTYNNNNLIYPSRVPTTQQKETRTQTPTRVNNQLECGATSPRFAHRHLISGGENLIRGAWPWLVAIHQKDDYGLSFLCGGNLISINAVLTAAHCFRSAANTYRESDIAILVGRHNLTDWNENGVVSTGVSKIHIHHDYQIETGSDISDADIAIAITNKQISFSVYIKPICLWSGSTDKREIEYMNAAVAGWGRDENYIPSRIPKRAQAQVIPNDVCIKSNNNLRYSVTNRTLCAGNLDGTGPCNGDSGGGLVLFINNKWILRGIVSLSLSDPITNKCDLKNYVVYTDVAHFVPWINEIIR